jgi:hypothetical protein
MVIYVGYILGDYAHAVWISTEKATVEKAIENYRKEGGNRPAWVDEYLVGKDLTELDCD